MNIYSTLIEMNLVIYVLPLIIKRKILMWVCFIKRLNNLINKTNLRKFFLVT